VFVVVLRVDVNHALELAATKDQQPVETFAAHAFDPALGMRTTNTIEALHRQIRKTIKTRGHFPTEEAARKLIYLSITNAQKSCRQTYHWSAALLSFKIHFGDRPP
jgi:putative transposase